MGRGILRPCLYVVIENLDQPHLRTDPIPMVVDTGADHCIFARELAPEIGINVDGDGGRLQRVFPLGGEPRLIREYPVQITIPQIGHRFSLWARFDSFANGGNGVLGYGGFLSFLDIRFFYRERLQILDVRSKVTGDGVGVGGFPA